VFQIFVSCSHSVLVVNLIFGIFDQIASTLTLKIKKKKNQGTRLSLKGFVTRSRPLKFKIRLLRPIFHLFLFFIFSEKFKKFASTLFDF